MKCWPNISNDMNSNNDLCNLVAQFRSFIREFFLRLFLVLPYIFFFIISHQKMFLSFISVFAFWVIFATKIYRTEPIFEKTESSTQLFEKSLSFIYFRCIFVKTAQFCVKFWRLSNFFYNFSEKRHFILWKALIQSVYQLWFVQQVKF